MMFNIKPTAGHRKAVIRLAAMAQAAVLMFAGLTASAQEGNRLQDIQVKS